MLSSFRVPDSTLKLCFLLRQMMGYTAIVVVCFFAEIKETVENESKGVHAARRKKKIGLQAC